MGVFYCGFSGHGQFEEKYNSSVHIVGDDVTTACCCWSNVIFVTESGTKAVVLGFWDGKPDQRIETSLPNGETFKKISSRPNRIVCLSDTGQLWELKSNLWLSLATDQKFDTFAISEDALLAVSDGILFDVVNGSEVPISGYVVDVSCGAEHNVALTRQGDVFSWGSSMRGQLGRGDLGSSNIPVVIDALSVLGVKEIYCGSWHSVALTTSGDVYCWGWNRDGQLGFPCPPLKASDTTQKNNDEKVSVLANPEPLDIPFSVQQVACGVRHTLILADDGGVWGFGWSGHGQLGDQYTDSSMSRVSVTSSRVRHISAGGWGSLLFSSTND